MYYKNALSKTVKYVEENLCEPFSLEDLVEVNGFSQWHFSRLFHAFTGYSISDYIRARRLTEAANELFMDKKIINIALDYQFSSQDSFTRAFKKAFQITPARYRKNGLKKVLTQPLDINKLVWIQGGQEMKPEVVILKDLKVCGMVYTGKNENGEVPALWQDFLKRIPEISNAKGNGASYGVCEPLEESVDQVNWEVASDIRYMASIEVTSDHAPDGMEVWSVPHEKYAVFTHIGSVETLGETYKSIYSKWLPESGYEVVFTYDFELYDKDFKPGQEDSKMYIYIPIK